MSIVEKKISAGNISATVWNNKREMNGVEIEMKSISLQRSYKDKNGEWKHSTSFSINDLPKIQLVMDKTYEYLTMQKVEA